MPKSDFYGMLLNWLSGKLAGTPKNSVFPAYGLDPPQRRSPTVEPDKAV
jgi:hypothetical protein